MTLATVETITDLQPVEKADNLVLAIVQGWECLVQKGDFMIGDLCVLVPIDVEVKVTSNLFHFLAPQARRNKEWFKISTRRLRGVYSQGLVVSFEHLRNAGYTTTHLKHGDDLSDTLPVRKYI
jgi:RNA ligase (TIGR02306 family)